MLLLGTAPRVLAVHIPHRYCLTSENPVCGNCVHAGTFWNCIAGAMKLDRGTSVGRTFPVGFSAHCLWSVLVRNVEVELLLSSVNSPLEMDWEERGCLVEGSQSWEGSWALSLEAGWSPLSRSYLTSCLIPMHFPPFAAELWQSQVGNESLCQE